MSLRSKLITIFAVIIVTAVSVLTAYSSFYQRQTYMQNEVMTQKQVLSLIYNNVSVQLYAFTNEQLQGVLFTRNILHEKGQTLSNRISEMQYSIEQTYGVKFNDFPDSSVPKYKWSKAQLEAESMFLRFLSFEKASYNKVGADIVVTYDLDVLLPPINKSIANGTSVSNRALLPTMLSKTNQYSAGYYLSIFNREFSTVANLADNIADSAKYLSYLSKGQDIAPPEDRSFVSKFNPYQPHQSSASSIDSIKRHSSQLEDDNEADVVILLPSERSFNTEYIGDHSMLEEGKVNKRNNLKEHNKNYLSYLFKTHMDSPFTYAIVQSVDQMLEQYEDVEGKVLARMQEHMDRLSDYLKGEALIMSSSGELLSSSKSTPLFSQAPDKLYQYCQEQRQVQLDNKAIYGDQGYRTYERNDSFLLDHEGKTYLVNTIYFRPLGWFIINAVDLDVITNPAISSAMVLVIIGGIIMVISLVVTALMSNSIARRIMTLASKAKVMSSANLSDYNAIESITSSIKISGKDEVADLGHAFKRMGVSMSRNINLLMAANSQKNRMEGELNAAKDIQMGMLPSIDELPHSEHLASAALLYPAKEVGGDLYDIYRLDEHHIIYAVGDVSDKGVPAALFMATTVTLARTCLCMGMSPQETMTVLNGRLSERNPNMMFVTMYICILDELTGEVVGCNAGHCPPVIIRRDLVCADDKSSEPCLQVVKVEEMDEISGPAVGPMPGIEYSQYSFTLGEYDLMLLYTDGVSEAQNAQGGFFGVERILDIASLATKGSPDSLITALNDEVSLYRGTYQQSDDITMVACSRLGPTKK